MVWFDQNVPRKWLVGHVLWFAAWLGVTVVGVVLSPSPSGHGTHQQLGLPPCPSVLFTHHPCPGCGLTTSIVASVHLRFTEAFRAHAFGPILYGLFTASAFACLYGFIRERRFNTNSPALNWSLGGLIGLFLLYGVYRFCTSTVYVSVEPLLRTHFR